jgi:predicted RNA binding protein YcfA (HicA-like mRNA interferase family)
MSKTPRLSAKEIIAALGKAGFVIARSRAVIISSSIPMDAGLLLKILRTCEIDLEQLDKLLR